MSDLYTQLRDYGRQIESDPLLSAEAPRMVDVGIRPPRPRLGRGLAWALAAFAVVLAVGGLYIAFSGGDGQVVNQTTIPTPTTGATTARPTALSEWPPFGPVEPGTYQIPASGWNVAGFTMTLPEGWEIDPVHSPGVAKNYDSEDEVSFYPVVVDAIYSDPCVGSAGDEGGELMEVGPSVDDLAQALLDQPHTVATGPVDTTFGGLPAKRIDLTVEDDPETATCNLDVPGHLQIWHSVPVDKFFVLLGDGTASVYIVDVNGERQVFLTQYRAGATADDISEMQTILESIRIDQ